MPKEGKVRQITEEIYPIEKSFLRLKRNRSQGADKHLSGGLIV